jgi:ubiquinone/menaquinone biosynthesis C-methylase UbiE
MNLILLRKKLKELLEKDVREKILSGLKNNDLILDVGSGGRPLPEANVLCDLFPHNNFHRSGESLRYDGKPFVVSDIHFLPFKDKAFAFVNCSHVIEHVKKPYLAMKEIRRVGKIVYIESPTWFSEMVIGWNCHSWVVRRTGKFLAFQPIKISSTSRLRKLYHFLSRKSVVFTAIELILDKVFELFHLKYVWLDNNVREIMEKTD